MTKIRLEAFSDGVFAIVITLLVLDIKIPQTNVTSNQELNALLKEVIPNILIFIFTFLVVGVFWVAHYRIFNFIKVIDNYLLWVNVFYLMTVAVIPFPASILARHPFLPTSILFYSSTLLAVGLTHFVFLRHTCYRPALKQDFFSVDAYRLSRNVALVGPCCYLAADIFSFISPGVSFCFIAAALIFYIFIASRFISKAQPEINE